MILIRIMGKLPVTLAPDDNQRWWIAGNPLLPNKDHSAVADEQRSIQRQRTPQNGAEWPFVKPLDAKNEALTLSFTTSRLFETTVEAWRWRNRWSALLERDWPHPITGDFVMRFLLPGGGWEEERLYDCLISKPTMKADGLTLTLGYTITGGRIEPYGTGVDVVPVADSPPAGSVHLKLYCTTDGGELTDYQSGKNFGLPASTYLTTGSVLTVLATDNISSAITTKNFEVVASSGATPSNPGFIPLVTPLNARLAQIAAEFADDPNVAAYHITTGRPYVLLVWRAAPAGDASEVSINVTASTPLGANTTEEWTTAADNVQPSEPLLTTLPLDDAGDIPVADLPN